MVPKVQAVIAREKNAPASVETIPDPGPGEALVNILSCGVCPTNPHYKQGGSKDDFPSLLDHEAIGVVSAVGDGGTSITPGDRVILNWRAVCGDYRACAKGQPKFCFNIANATQKMTLEDGTELSPALGMGAFAEKTIVTEGQCTKVDPDVDAAGSGLLGCGVLASSGAAINNGEVKRCESVAAIGCGGVGIAAISGANTIIAVDIDVNKVKVTKYFGATHGSDSIKEDPIEAARALTGGNGVDVVIDPVGRPEPYKQAFYAGSLPAAWSWWASRRRL